MTRSAALAVVALGLSGCALVGSSRPSTTYDLSAPNTFPKKAPGARGVLVVPEPTALKSLDSDRIAVKPGSAVVAYYPDSVWADRLPKLLQVRTIQAFENAARLRSVGRPSDGLAPDYQLIMDIRAFELEATTPPTAVVEITAKLVGVQGGESGAAAAAKLITARVPAAGDKPADAVTALGAALDQVLTELVGWATGVI